jgi:acyl-coenzyme A thioesterase PaaI-like protein
MDLISLAEKARRSSFYMWFLNFAFNRFVPFNRPHGFRILEIGDYHVKTLLPFRRNNLNHLKGLHACALATLTEITGGFLLALKLDPGKYRLILKKLEVDYLYQGKTDAFGELRITPEWLNNSIIAPLQNTEAVEVVTEVTIMDKAGNALTNGRAIWQVKDWRKVKTKLTESK